MRKVVVLCGLLALTGLAFADEVKPYKVAPEYPPAAMAAKYDGAVLLAAVVNADGTVGEIQVMDSLRPNLGFEEAAVAAVKQWRFEPATKNGDPVASVAAFQLDFHAPSAGVAPIVTNEFLGGAVLDLDSKTGAGYDLGSVLASGALPPTHDNMPFERVKIQTPSRPHCINDAPACMYDRREILPQPTRFRSTVD